MYLTAEIQPILGGAMQAAEFLMVFDLQEYLYGGHCVQAKHWILNGYQP